MAVIIGEGSPSPDRSMDHLVVLRSQLGDTAVSLTGAKMSEVGQLNSSGSLRTARLRMEDFGRLE